MKLARLTRNTSREAAEARGNVYIQTCQARGRVYVSTADLIVALNRMAQGETADYHRAVTDAIDALARLT